MKYLPWVIFVFLLVGNFEVNDLLIGQHGLIDWIPVDDLCFAVGDAFIEHFQEKPLVPLVVIGIAGGNLAAPVNSQPHGLHLLLHVGDIFVGPFCRRHPVFQGSVFCRQAKGIPSHGHQHIEALHAQLTPLLGRAVLCKQLAKATSWPLVTQYRRQIHRMLNSRLGKSLWRDVFFVNIVNLKWVSVVWQFLCFVCCSAFIRQCSDIDIDIGICSP